MSTSRIVRGAIWAAITIVLAVGGILEISIGNSGGAVVALLFAALTGWFDLRIWLPRARRAGPYS
ncbi:MAG TPA: hypothetical protein VFQ44_16245 [Streptosporangiaceae bacterium]|nr:hypothetical protein [Streptosporangiaceae bacterium]